MGAAGWQIAIFFFAKEEGRGGRTQTPEITKVRNSISYDSLDHVYLRAFLFSIQKKKTKKKTEKSEAKNLCVEVHWGWGGGEGVGGTPTKKGW